MLESIAFVVMAGTRPIAVFTGPEAELSAPKFAMQLAGASFDDPPDVALKNGVWIARVQQDPPA